LYIVRFLCFYNFMVNRIIIIIIIIMKYSCIAMYMYSQISEDALTAVRGQRLTGVCRDELLGVEP